MDIRAARSDDPIRDVAVAAFGREVVGDLVEALADAARVSLVAEVDGIVVGHVLLTRNWLDAPPRVVEVLVLSPLGVLPSYQGRGVGGGLVRAALDQAEAYPLVFLEGSPAYYPRFGFRPGGELGLTPPSTRIPGAAFQVVANARHEPWMTGALVYTDAFWVHDCVGLRSP